ncbi:hypothetical protein F0L74_00695 [Chitinophaga agrisoli]|uniref:Lipoprotein n=1 Tax=Chitinophaga agrisoli TaxID=2607653 RepID=A0A5B2W2P8_9BACT|nr:hypothetical protein [Chitinophaga agrisoli]KAA2244529.1 hypothetical protein F0L74_00695 [Chitinophaga agrisoli]
MKSYFCFNRILAVVLVLVTVATIFFACSKNNEAGPESDQNDNEALTAAAYEAQISTLYDDLFDVALEASQTQGLGSKNGRVVPQDPQALKLGNCYDPQVDDVTIDKWPKTLTLNFGSGCTGVDGRVRSGTLVLVLSGYIFIPGTTVTITSQNYAINGIQLKGTKTLVNQSTANGFKYSSKVVGGIVAIDSLDLTFNYTSDKTITQTKGAATPFDASDDEYSGTGTATLSYGTTSVSYTVKEPLIKAVSCPWIGGGKAEISLGTTNASAKATIDYGLGLCDDSVTIIMGDKMKGAILPR